MGPPGVRQSWATANLEKLYLERTNITGTGCEHLKGLANLHFLCLNNAKITDAGLESLTKLTGLLQTFKWHWKNREFGV